MLDFTNFSNQYPDPNKDQILRILEEVKRDLIAEFELRTLPDSTTLESTSVFGDSEYVAIHMTAFDHVHHEVIPGLQGLLPPQFGKLIKTELSKWISDGITIERL